MKNREVLSLIEGGENLHCEFKQRFSTHEKIAKEMIAFANTSGGYIIFGIEDDGTVTGVPSEKTESELIRTVAESYCEPVIDITIHYFEMKSKEIVVVEVPASGKKPHRVADGAEYDINTSKIYVRLGEKSIQASKEMIRIMRAETLSKGLQSFAIGDLERRVFDYLDYRETISVQEMAAAMNVSSRRASRTLVKLVRAGALLLHQKENGEEFFSLKEEL